MEENRLLGSLQFQFRKSKSTLHATDRLVRDVLRTFEAKGIVQATLCDLSRLAL